MRKVAWAELGGRGSFIANPRYAAVPVEEDKGDPVAEAYQAGYAEGESTARAAAQTAADDAAAAQRAIELAFARFDDRSARLLEERLRQTVAAICQAMAGDIALDAERLAARVEAAAAMLRRKHDERVVCLNPADLALVRSRVAAELRLEPDPSLARGQLRVEGEEGGIEDGAEQWRAALAEAIGPCSA